MTVTKHHPSIETLRQAYFHKLGRLEGFAKAFVDCVRTASSDGRIVTIPVAKLTPVDEAFGMLEAAVVDVSVAADTYDHALDRMRREVGE